MRYLTLKEVIALHRRALEATGGSDGIRDMNSVNSAVVQPLMTIAGEELYPTLAEKGAALAFSLVKNHPFVDGNKRAGHAAMVTFFQINDHVLTADDNEQERVMLELAAGAVSREELTEWVRKHLAPETA